MARACGDPPAYIAGQRQALQEVLEFMQAMLDHSGSQSGGAHAQALPAGSGASGATSLGQIDGSRLINFICVSTRCRLAVAVTLVDPERGD